jgi:mono/diheme cytochrome c family protein
MFRKFKPLMVASVLSGITAITGQAAADSVGEAEFRENCATCHGAAAMGKGPLAEFMSVDVPDLTSISERNDGVFPTLNIIHIIDGRTGLRGHGSEMPVWGNDFTKEAELVGDFSPFLATRGRILSIVYYLESIQK